MSYLDKAKAILAEMHGEAGPMPEPATPLDLPACMDLLATVFAEIERSYTCGDLAELDADADLGRRFRDAEDAIDGAVKAGPTEADLRAALTAFVTVLAECSARRRARGERAA